MNKQQRKKPKMPYRPPTKEEVLKTCRQSGLPFEIRVAAICRDLGTRTTMGWRWLDARKNTPREIDVIATKTFQTPDCTVCVHAFIECKQKAPGVVIFGDPSSSPLDDFFAMNAHYWGQPALIGNGKSSPKPVPYKFGWGHSRWGINAATGTHYSSVNYLDENGDRESHDAECRWDIRRNDLYEPIDYLIRGAGSYARDQWVLQSKKPIPFLNFFALFVVVDGPIFHHAEINGVANIEEVTHASVSLWNDAGIDDHAHFRVDFVRSSELFATLGFLFVKNGDAENIFEDAKRDVPRLVQSTKIYGNTHDGSGVGHID